MRRYREYYRVLTLPEVATILVSRRRRGVHSHLALMSLIRFERLHFRAQTCPTYNVPNYLEKLDYYTGIVAA